MRKVGTNFTDRNDIRDYVEAGVTDATRIARNLNCEVKPVQGYIDSLTAPVIEACEPEVEAEPKPRRRRKKVEEEEVIT
jgi:hypothetical protein